MKKIIILLIVGFIVFIFAVGFKTSQRESVDMDHTNCDVVWEWTLTNGYMPVWHCAIDAGM